MIDAVLKAPDVVLIPSWLDVHTIQRKLMESDLLSLSPHTVVKRGPLHYS